MPFVYTGHPPLCSILPFIDIKYFLKYAVSRLVLNLFLINGKNVAKKRVLTFATGLIAPTGTLVCAKGSWSGGVLLCRWLILLLLLITIAIVLLHFASRYL